MAQPIGLDEASRAEWSAAPTIVALSTSSARNGSDLGQGAYYLISDVDCFFLQGDSTVAATTSSNFLPAKTPVMMRVSGSSTARVAAILSSGTGNLYIQRPL